jgi:biotin carboxyl carrier protein
MDDIKLYAEEPEPIPEDQLELFSVGEDSFYTTLSDKHKNRKPYSPINLKEIKAAIPGVIRKHYVKVGDKVKLGDKLIILEAMKMKNDILATDSGVVEEMVAKIGDRVPKDTLLVRLK